MGDNTGVDISALLGDQPLIDESTLPDADGPALEGGDDSQGDGGSGALDLVPNDEPPAGQKNTQVPLSALQQERERRQEYQDLLKQKEQQQQQMEQRFQQMMQLMQQQQQAAQPQQPAAPEIPSFIDDPEAHINGLKAEFERRFQAMEQHYVQQLQAQQAAGQQQQVARSIAAAEAEFAGKTPDYNQAAAFFAQRKQLEYAAMGADPYTAQQALQQDYMSIAQVAQRNNQNPAQVLYNLSKAMGYTAQAPQQQQQQQQRQGQPQAKKQAPTSLSNVAGTPRAPDEQGGLTLESISSMTDAEFDKFWKDMERGSVQRPKF